MTKKRSVGRPTREQAAAIDDEILAAARDVFCRDGFSDASMSEIAERIGASKLTLYRRFESKMGLLVAVIDRNIASLRAVMDETTVTQASASDALQQTAIRLFNFLTERDNLAFGLVIRAESARSPLLRERCANWISIMEAPLILLIIRSQEEGAITRHVNAATLASILSDLIDGVAERLRNESSKLGSTDLQETFETRWKVFLAFAATR